MFRPLLGLILIRGAVLTAIIPLLLLVPVTGTAQQAGGFGDPSNLAGTWKITLLPGTHLVSFPILPAQATLENVIGNQLPGGTEWENSTRLIGIGTTVIRGSYFNEESQQWIGTLSRLELSKGYWLVIPEDAEPVDLRLMGAALEDSLVDMGRMRPGVNLVGTGFPYPTTLSASGLTGSGFAGARYLATSDRVFTWNAGTLLPAWYDPANGWRGARFDLVPTRGYIVVVAPGHEGFDWRQPRPEIYRDGGPAQVVTSFGVRNMSLPMPDFSKPPWGEGPPPDDGDRNKREMIQVEDAPPGQSGPPERRSR